MIDVIKKKLNSATEYDTHVVLSIDEVKFLNNNYKFFFIPSNTVIDSKYATTILKALGDS